MSTVIVSTPWTLFVSLLTVCCWLSTPLLCAGEASSIRFLNSDFSVPENIGLVTVTVERSGDTVAALTAEYLVSGTATSGDDHAASAGSLSFGAGESTKQISFSVMEDALYEQAETIVFTLKTASGGVAVGGPESLTITLLNTTPLAKVSGASATPSSAYVGIPLQFSYLVNAPDASYSWDFSDGTPTASGSNVAHVFDYAGSYSVIAMAAAPDGQSLLETISVVVEVAAPTTDLDGDGYTKQVEETLGSSAYDASQRPQGLPLIASKKELAVRKLGLKLNFAAPNNDMLTLQGTLAIPSGFSLAGQHVIVDIGGIVVSFQLNAKGSAKSGKSAIKVTAAPKATTAKINVKMAKSNLCNSLVDEKLTDRTTKNEPVSIQVAVYLATARHERAVGLKFSAKQYQKGFAK